MMLDYILDDKSDGRKFDLLVSPPVVVSPECRKGSRRLRSWLPIRRLDGVFLRPLIMTGPEGPKTGDWLRKRAADIRSWHVPAGNVWPSEPPWNEVRETTDEEGGLIPVSSDLVERQEWVVRQLSPLVLVDGLVFEPVEEPVFEFNPRFPKSGLSLNFRRPGDGDHRDAIYFRLDQADFAKAWIQKELALSDIKSEPLLIERPDLLGRPVEAESLLEAANLLAFTTEHLGKYRRQEFRGRPVDFDGAWRLRRSAEDHRAVLKQRLSRVTVGEFEDLADGVQEFLRRNHENHAEGELRSAWSIADAALRRWQEKRPIPEDVDDIARAF